MSANLGRKGKWNKGIRLKHYTNKLRTYVCWWNLPAWGTKLQPVESGRIKLSASWDSMRSRIGTRAKPKWPGTMKIDKCWKHSKHVEKKRSHILMEVCPPSRQKESRRSMHPTHSLPDRENRRWKAVTAEWTPPQRVRNEFVFSLDITSTAINVAQLLA